jgi:hypothetical protein
MVPAPGGRNTIHFNRQLQGNRPKLSLHESGRCNAAVDDGQEVSVFGRSLVGPVPGHIASITSFDPTRQPQVAKPKGFPNPDFVLQPSVPGSLATIVALHVCASEEDAKARHCRYWLTLRRPERTLLLGVSARIPEAPVEPQVAGVVVIGGWGPGSDDRPLTGVYVSTALDDDPSATMERRGINASYPGEP